MKQITLFISSCPTTSGKLLVWADNGLRRRSLFLTSAQVDRLQAKGCVVTY